MMLRGFSGGKRITDCLKLNSIPAEIPCCMGDSATSSTAPQSNDYINSLFSYWFPS